VIFDTGVKCGVDDVAPRIEARSASSVSGRDCLGSLSLPLNLFGQRPSRSNEELSMKLNVSLLALFAAITATAAAASPTAPAIVPEIDALSGTAALAAVAGAVLFVRERMKR
jgi:hypothetical protein